MVEAFIGLTAREVIEVFNALDLVAEVCACDATPEVSALYLP